MTNLCFNSIRFMSLLSFRSTNLCSICKRNPFRLKLNVLNFNNVSIAENTTFSSFLILRNNLKSFQPKYCFSTSFVRNQRFTQIYRNAEKEKLLNIENNPEWQQLKEMSLFKKFKVMFKKYWYISVPVHCITCCLWFAFLYLVAKSGFDIKPLLEKIRPTIEKLPIPDMIKKPFMSDHKSGDTVGYVAVTFVLYKLLTPARYATTVGTSFYAIKYLVKRGLIKPVPSSHQIKAQVFKSKTQLNQALKERLAKRENIRKINKIRKKTKH